MRARSQSSAIDTLQQFDFLFQFYGIESPFLPTFLHTHSLVCVCVRTLTPQTSQCVLNKCASRSWITFIIYWKERRNDILFLSIECARCKSEWKCVWCIWLRASEWATFIKNKVKDARRSACAIGDGLRGQHDRTKEMQKNRKYFIK